MLIDLARDTGNYRLAIHRYLKDVDLFCVLETSTGRAVLGGSLRKLADELSPDAATDEMRAALRKVVQRVESDVSGDGETHDLDRVFR